MIHLTVYRTLIFCCLPAPTYPILSDSNYWSFCQILTDVEIEAVGIEDEDYNNAEVIIKQKKLKQEKSVPNYYMDDEDLYSRYVLFIILFS